MRTSEEIFHRVRWDARFDAARFTLGVAQRGAEPKRVPLVSFVPGGEIPWHRVLFIEADGEVLWDRSAGIDRIDTTGAGRVREARLLCAPFFEPRAVPEGPAGPSARSPRVLTWNTLWDRYDSDRIDTARRRPLLLEALRTADADVIALQEVEPALLAMVRRAAWVREAYTVVPGTRDVDQYGLLLLSRLPVREAGLHPLGRHKAVLAVVVETADGPLTLATTHLSSDHSVDGAALREAQLAEIAGGLGGDVVLMGDFNDPGDLPQRTLGLVDAWTAVHGVADTTPTFDPVRNPLAAVSSLTGRAGRIDRVLLRGPRAGRAELRGEGEFISDHYGVLVELGREPVEEVVLALGAEFAEGVVHVAGSRRMGCALPGADLDLVLVLPGPEPAKVCARVRRALPGAEAVREVTGARVPGVRFRAGALAVDLVVVGCGGIPVADAVRRRDELGGAAAVALSAVSDAVAVLASVGAERDAFVRLAREVKSWARARGLDSAPFGGVPGIGWAVLAALTVREAEGRAGGELLRYFFGRWAAWDWRNPVGGDVPAPTMAIMTPSEPVRSCTEQVSATGCELLVRESYRAWEITGSGPGPWPELLIPPTVADHAAWAVVTVRPAGGGEIETLDGRVRGRMRALLAALAEAGSPDAYAWPRPLPHGGGGILRYAIGLGATPPDGTRLAEIGAAWSRGLSGVTLAPAGPGGIVALC
ncbi:RNA repair domain-containing protein [Streptomyces sp. CAU 1734]|uniref:RNA repair domain-containing protein n=1 Tax=Streptomyces sp. CAU 1734 TaxID=3140360 RepID=UPI00326084A5